MNTYLGMPDLAEQHRRYRREYIGMWIARAIVWSILLAGMYLVGRL